MPYIDVNLTKKLSEENKNSLKTALGEMISVFPGKSESWLMVSVEDGKSMWFRGDASSDSAFVEVKLFGTVDKGSADSFTSRLCSYFKAAFGIDPSRVYVRYEGGTDWGWNGANF